MSRVIDIEPLNKLVAIYESNITTVDQLDEGPKTNPLAHLDRVIFHSQLPYWRVAAYQQPVRTVLPIRTGRGDALFKPPAWPARHGVPGSQFHVILLVGKTPRRVTQHSPGDVIPGGYVGRAGWRRMSVTIKTGGVKIIDYWQGGPPTRTLFLGYILLQTAAGMPAAGAANRVLFEINPTGAEPYLRVGNFDTRKDWIRGTQSGEQFTFFASPHIYVDKDSALVAMTSDGGYVRRPGTVVKRNLVPPKRPVRVKCKAW